MRGEAYVRVMANTSQWSIAPETPATAKSLKTLKSEFGEFPIEVPRGRQGVFGPQRIPKHQNRRAGFDDKVILLCAPGLTVREVLAYLEEICGTEDAVCLQCPCSWKVCLYRFFMQAGKRISR